MSDSKRNVVRVLVVSSTLLFILSGLMKQWLIGIPAFLLLVVALIYAFRSITKDTSEERLKLELMKDQRAMKLKKTGGPPGSPASPTGA